MKPISYGDDYAYADSRLRGTVLLTLDKKPILIHHVFHDTGNIEADDVLKGSFIECHLNDLDLKPPEIGYLDSKKSGAIFCQRNPVRYYKQGLTERNIIGFRASNNRVVGIPVYSINFGQMLLKNYKKPLDVIERIVVGEASCMPLGLNWATIIGDGVKDLSLLYKNYRVGKLKWNDNGDINYQLHKDFEFLDTIMEKELYGKCL